MQKEGIHGHLDERTKYDEKHAIFVVRILSSIYMRFGAVRFGKNPLFMIPFAANSVMSMRPWFAGADWIKHCIDIKDMSTTTGSFMIRRIYPFLLMMAAQKQLFN